MQHNHNQESNDLHVKATQVIDIAKEADSIIRNAQTYWDELIESISNLETNVQQDNVISQLEYIEELESARSCLIEEIHNLDNFQSKITKCDQSILSEHERNYVCKICHDVDVLLQSLNEKIDDFLDTYNDLIEEVLDNVEDAIVMLTEQVFQKRASTQAMEIRMDPDYEEQLEDIRDSLEHMRTLRLEAVEVNEEEDHILRILDTQITAIDSALLIDESSL